MSNSSVERNRRQAALVVTHRGFAATAAPHVKRQSHTYKEKNMLRWNTLHQNLENVANRHQRLVSRFNEFAKFVEAQVTDQTFHIKGITTSLHLEQGFFTTTFSGRTLHFAFSSATEDGGSLIGNVKCYLKRGFPEPTYIVVGEFTFTGSGQTNLIEPEDNGPVTIDTDLPSLYVALHFMHESLSK